MERKNGKNNKDLYKIIHYAIIAIIRKQQGTRQWLKIRVGTKEYLGIEINYNKEKTFDKFSLDTLKDRYFWEGETHAQEAFARASVFGATFKGETDFELAQRLYNYSFLSLVHV